MLTIHHMTKVYKTGRGIFDIDLQVAQGEIYGLLGPNGAGKTTLLKIVAGLLNKGSGTCSINDADAEKQPLTYKKGLVGMISDTVLYDYLTPMEHLKMMELYHPEMTLQDKEAALTEMALWDYKDEKTKQFSTGMKQRLAFAMCLVAKPMVLLLDEPFSGLDIEGKILIRNRLQQLKDDGETAVLISSHLIHDLEEIATKVGVIKEGRLVDEQDVKTLLRHHRNLEDYFIRQTATLKEGA